MDRTLYLSERPGLTVLRDGPSIFIKQKGCADRRVPVRLIGRVVIIGNLKMEAGVITLFTKNNVPVLTIDKQSESAAVTVPLNDKVPFYYHNQRVFLETEGNVNRFMTWLYSKKRIVQLCAIKRLSKGAASKFMRGGFKEQDYHRFIRRKITSSEGQWKTVRGTIENLLLELVIARLLQAGLDPNIGVLNRRRNIGFALDLVNILGAEANVQCIQFFKRNREDFMEFTGDKWLISSEGMKNVVHRFENRRQAVTNFVEKLIDELFELMRELSYEVELPGLL